MALVTYLRGIKDHSGDLVDEVYRMYLSDHLLQAMQNIENYKKVTIISEFTAIFGNQYSNIAESVISKYYEAKNLFFRFDINMIYDIFNANFAINLFTKEFDIPKGNIVDRLFVLSVLTSYNFNSFVKDFKSVTELDDEKSFNLSSILFSIYNRRRNIFDGNRAECFWYEFFCTNPHKYKFCADNKNKNFHINEIFSMKNNDGKSSLLFGGGLKCSGTWEVNPFEG